MAISIWRCALYTAITSVILLMMGVGTLILQYTVMLKEFIDTHQPEKCIDTKPCSINGIYTDILGFKDRYIYTLHVNYTFIDAHQIREYEKIIYFGGDYYDMYSCDKYSYENLSNTTCCIVSSDKQQLVENDCYDIELKRQYNYMIVIPLVITMFFLLSSIISCSILYHYNRGPLKTDKNIRGVKVFHDRISREPYDHDNINDYLYEYSCYS